MILNSDNFITKVRLRLGQNIITSHFTSVYQLHLAKGNDLDASYDFSMTNSMKNHYYYDAYNPVLKRTNTLGQDTTARRIDPKHGFLKV